jgi:RNA polymerase sigma-70 factor (ECF subfamily)
MSNDALLLATASSDGDDDPALARRVAAGDVPAFERLMRRHNRRLYRLARATLRDAHEAEDALQEAYLSAYRAIGQFRGEAALATWLSRLVLNECLGRLRKQARRDNVVPMLRSGDGAGDEATLEAERDAMDSPAAERPDQALGRAEMRALIERKLDELPEVFRVVFVLRCVEELSVEETAQCLGIPEATVRTRHVRARSLLREALAQDIDLAERDVFSFDGARCDRIVAQVLARRDEGGAGSGRGESGEGSERDER